MKSSQGPVKFVIGCRTRPGTTLVYTKEKNVRVTIEFEVHIRHSWRSKLSIDMVQHVLQWERQNICSSRKRQGPMAEKRCYNKVLILKGKRRQIQEMTREWSNFNFFLNRSFWTCIKKTNTFPFRCTVIPLGPHSVYTFLARGPKTL